MKKLLKKEFTERENTMLLAGRPCFCGCGCNVVCSCPPIPSHQIQYNQESTGSTMSGLSASGGTTSDRGIQTP